MTQQERKKIEDEFLSNNMKKLKNIARYYIRKKRLPHSFDEELFEVAMITFCESLNTYNPERCKFATYLSGNIQRAFYDWSRDATREKRCVKIPDIDEETGIQKRDEDGNLLYKPTYDISLFSETEDGNELWTIFSDDNTVESIIFTENIKISKKVEKLLSNISKRSKKVALLIMDGYSEEVICNTYGITRRCYVEAIRELKFIATTMKC